MKPATRAAMALSTFLLLAGSAQAAPSARTYEATFSGTQESSWTFEETGTCTGDDGETYPFNGQGSGKASLSFRTPEASKVVAFRVGQTNRWGFNLDASPILASQKRKAPLVKGTVTGTHSQTCPNNKTSTFTSPASECGERTYPIMLRARLNLPALKAGELELLGQDTQGGGTGAKWGDECPYFFGLDRFKAHGDEDPPHHIPAGGLLTVRKAVGTNALRRGKTLTINGKRTMPYDQTIAEGETTKRVRGETVVRWKLVLRPKR